MTTVGDRCCPYGTRALQAETGGFTEFVPLPFLHMAAHVPLEQRTTLYGRTHIEPVPVPG